MKELNLKLTGLNKKFNPRVIVDGEEIKVKRNDFGAYEGSFKTEKEEVSVEVYRVSELSGKLWFLYSMITFIISIFGIFEPLYDRKCIALDCKYRIKLSEQTVFKINFAPLNIQGKASTAEANGEYVEEKNSYFVDKKLKRRWRLLLALKILIWLVAIVVAIVLIANNV